MIAFRDIAINLKKLGIVIKDVLTKESLVVPDSVDCTSADYKCVDNVQEMSKLSDEELYNYALNSKAENRGLAIEILKTRNIDTNKFDMQHLIALSQGLVRPNDMRRI